MEEVIEALRPFVEFHDGGESWKGTVWEFKDADTAVLYDYKSGRKITIADFIRAANALANL